MKILVLVILALFATRAFGRRRRVEISPEEHAMVFERASKGDHIGAMKLYRQYTQCGLLEAKEAVEAMEKQAGV